MDVELWAVLPDALASSFLQWLWQLTENMHKVYNKRRLDQVGIFDWLIRFSIAANPPLEVVDSAMKLTRSLVNEGNLEAHAKTMMRHLTALFATQAHDTAAEGEDEAAAAALAEPHGQQMDDAAARRT